MRYEKLIPWAVRLADCLYRPHPVARAREHLSCRPFFIIGSGRNGSTLLAAMLNKHPALLVPPEQFFLHMSIIKYKLFNFLPWEELVKIVLGEAADSRRSVRWDLRVNDLFDRLYRLPTQQRTLRRLIDEIFVAYGRQKGKTFELWGDKSPLTTYRFNYIFPVYRDARFVFLLRDGRDVVSSYIQGSAQEFQQFASLRHAAWLWNLSIRHWDRICREVPEARRHFLTYEQLVTDPEKTLTALVRFLGFDFHPDMLNFQDQASRLGVETMRMHQNLRRPLNPASIGKWRERLSREQQAELMPLIEKNLRRFGYLDAE